MASHPPNTEVSNLMSALICISYLFMNLCTYGLHFSFGVIYSELLTEFNEGHSKTAWIGSLPTSLTCSLSPLVVSAAKRFGVLKTMYIGAFFVVLSLLLSSLTTNVNQMIVSYGILYGLGSCALVTVTQVILPKVITRRLGTIYGIGSCGAALGPVILTPVINYLIKSHSWRMAFQIFSGCFSALLFSSLVVFTTLRQRFENKASDVGQKRVSWRDFTSLWWHGPYVVFAFALSVACLEYVVSYTHQVQFAIEMGVPRSKAAMIPTFMAISNAIGRATSGLVLDMKRIDPVYAFQLYLLSTGTVSFLGTLARTYTHFMTYFVTLMFFEGGFCAQTYYVLSRVVPTDRFPEATAMLLFGEGLFIALGPPLVGMIVDKTNNYSSLFFITGSPLIFAGLFMFLCRCMQPKMEFLKEKKPLVLGKDLKDTLILADPLKDNECLLYRISAL